jgi:hypothetical protein
MLLMFSDLTAAPDALTAVLVDLTAVPDVLTAICAAHDALQLLLMFLKLTLLL